MRLNVLIPPMAALFMSAPTQANVSRRFAIAPRRTCGRLLPGSAQLLRNKSFSTREVLVSVDMTSGGAALLHNGSRVGTCRKGLFNTLLTVEPDDTVELRMDLAQGGAQGCYTIEMI
jgi:hypothetical protein